MQGLGFRGVNRGLGFTDVNELNRVSLAIKRVWDLGA